jgi:hypothetical protein
MDLLKTIEAKYSPKDIEKLSKKMLERYDTVSSPEQLVRSFADNFPWYSPSRDDHREIRSVFNSLMKGYYHNEAFIKSSFINSKLLNGNHVVVFELPVGDSRADLCKINGHSYCYEIKTDYDTLARLRKQLSDYSKVFDYVFVICSRKRMPDVLPLLDDNVGLYVYDGAKEKPAYSLAKESKISNVHDPRMQLGCLSQKELQNAFSSNERKESIIMKELTKSPAFINSVFKKAIKSRYFGKWESFVDKVDEYKDIDYQFFYKTNYRPSIFY